MLSYNNIIIIFTDPDTKFLNIGYAIKKESRCDSIRKNKNKLIREHIRVLDVVNIIVFVF